jgi:hypothetical protein
VCTNSGLSTIQLASDLLEYKYCVNRGVSVPKDGRNVLLPSSAYLTAYSSEILFLIKLHMHDVTTQLTELVTVAATPTASVIRERNLKTKYPTQLS